MKELFEKKINLILIVVILVVAVLIIIPAASRGCATSTSNGEIVTKPATADEASTEEETTESASADVKINDSKVNIKKKNSKSSTTASASTKSDARKTSSSSGSKKSSKKSSSSSSKVFATAEPVEYKADYNTQWNAGYLIAVDAPDTSYSCGHVELSDKDRELVEKLCMGEFGSGGFTGAAMIAQAVKNAMYFDGYDNVQDVINNYHYTGRLTAPSQRVKDAVVYVFDMDKDAIQHRILYMYNPKLMDDGYSEFHESQRYICTFQKVRFFDR